MSKRVWETVCALAPAGSWTAGTAEQMIGVRKIRRSILMAKVGRVLQMGLLLRSALVRRLILRDVTAHGGRLTAGQVADATQDLLECAIADDILTTGEEIAPLDPAPCPITLVWGSDDAPLSIEMNAPVARRRLPQARFVVLEGVGHVPMIDDPESVARTILGTTARSTILM